MNWGSEKTKVKVYSVKSHIHSMQTDTWLSLNQLSVCCWELTDILKINKVNRFLLSALLCIVCNTVSRKTCTSTLKQSVIQQHTRVQLYQKSHQPQDNMCNSSEPFVKSVCLIRSTHKLNVFSKDGLVSLWLNLKWKVIPLWQIIYLLLDLKRKARDSPTPGI